MFQLNACNYCDDIFAETADVVLGDAWLPEYRADWRGTNIVVTRNATIDSILEGGRLSGEIVLDPLTIDRASESQGGNFRHRRDGLSVRLADDMRAGKWVPLKRIAPGSVRLSGQRKALVRQRRRISDTSHRMLADAKALHKLGHFVSGIQPLVEKYERIARGSLAERVRARLGRMFQRVKELTVRKNE